MSYAAGLGAILYGDGKFGPGPKKRHVLIRTPARKHIIPPLIGENFARNFLDIIPTGGTIYGEEMPDAFAMIGGENRNEVLLNGGGHWEYSIVFNAASQLKSHIG